MNHKKKFTLCQCSVLVLLFLASMNVFEKYFYFIIIAFVLLLFLGGRSYKIDYTSVLLILFSLVYILFYPKTRTNIMMIIRQFAYPICYLIGLNFLNKNDIKLKNEKYTQDKIIIAIIVAALGAFVHYGINLSINVNSTFRNNIDVWSGEYLNATGQAALSVMAIAVFVTTIFLANNYIMKIVGIAGFIVIFVYNLILAGRSLIVITIVALLTAIIYINITKNVQTRFGGIFLAMMSASVLLYSYIQNIGGIREIILGSNLSMRMDNLVLLEDIRWTRKVQYIALMLEYPFGGGKINDVVGGYGHDLFLDTYSDAGMFALILLLVFAGVAIGNLVKVLREKSASQYLKLLVLCMHVVLVLEFMIEPILAGMPWMFCFFCFYQGLLYCFCHVIEE